MRVVAGSKSLLNVLTTETGSASSMLWEFPWSLHAQLTTPCPSLNAHSCFEMLIIIIVKAPNTVEVANLIHLESWG